MDVLAALTSPLARRHCRLRPRLPLPEPCLACDWRGLLLSKEDTLNSNKKLAEITRFALSKRNSAGSLSTA